MYTVKDVAKLTGLSDSSIRYYTDSNLVPSLQRDKNNIRIFDQRSVEFLMTIKYLRACGLSITALQKYVNLCMEGDCTIEERYQIILEQKQRALQKLQEAQTMADFITEKANHYLEMIENKTTDLSNPLNRVNH